MPDTSNAAPPYRREATAPGASGQAPLATGAAGATATHTRQEPTTRLNPQPSERYEIAMVIQGAPGPFADIGGWVQYELSDDDAIPGGPLQPLQALAPSKNLPLVFGKEREGVYTTEVAVDAFVVDAGPGVEPTRHWRMSLFNTRLRGRSIRFTPDLSLEELRAGRPKTRYFACRNYLSPELENLHDSGESSPAKFDPDIQNELFAITLTPRRL